MTETEIEVVARYKKPSNHDRYGGIVADMRLRSADLGNAERLDYPRELIPEDGHFANARFTTRITISEERPTVTEYVREKTSLAAFEAEHRGIEYDEAVFFSFHPETGDFRGMLQILDERLPDWIGEEGDRRYMVIQLELRPSSSPESVEERREKFQTIYEGLEERHDY